LLSVHLLDEAQAPEHVYDASQTEIDDAVLFQTEPLVMPLQDGLRFLETKYGR
jgi:hypothetical protein